MSDVTVTTQNKADTYVALSIYGSNTFITAEKTLDLRVGTRSLEKGQMFKQVDNDSAEMVQARIDAEFVVRRVERKRDGKIIVKLHIANLEEDGGNGKAGHGGHPRAVDDPAMIWQYFNALRERGWTVKSEAFEKRWKLNVAKLTKANGAEIEAPTTNPVIEINSEKKEENDNRPASFSPALAAPYGQNNTATTEEQQNAVEDKQSETLWSPGKHEQEVGRAFRPAANPEVSQFVRTLTEAEKKLSYSYAAEYLLTKGYERVERDSPTFVTEDGKWIFISKGVIVSGTFTNFELDLNILQTKPKGWKGTVLNAITKMERSGRKTSTTYKVEFAASATRVNVLEALAKLV